MSAQPVFEHQDDLVPKPPVEAVPKTPEDRYLDSFQGYLQEVLGVDIATAEPAQAPDIAIAAHHFISDAIERNMQDPKKHKPGTLAIPREPIDHRIRDYFQRFGTNRRSKGEDMLKLEEEYLAARFKTLSVDSFAKGGRVPRISTFPEIELAFKLRQILEGRELFTASDALDALLAAHAERFITIAGHAGREAVSNPSQQTHGVHYWTVSDFPE